MRLFLPIGILVAVTAGAVAVAVWASVTDAPWESSEGGAKGSETLLCQDALERRKATEDALQEPVSLSNGTQVPLSAFSALRGSTLGYLKAEVTRLESKLRDIEQDIQRFCK